MTFFSSNMFVLPARLKRRRGNAAAPWRTWTALNCNEAIVPRSRIAKMQAQSTSLMPEGLEEGLTSQDLADLLDFIFADIN